MPSSIPCPPLSGVFVAVPTFYGMTYDVDFASVGRYLKWLFSFKVNGVVICGTTGEGMAHSLDEYEDLIRLAVHLAPEKTHIMAGTYGVVPSAVVRQIQRAEKGGAHSALVLSPHETQPSQKGIVDYYSAIHAATRMPMVMDHHSSCTGTAIAVDTVHHLSTLKRIVGIKDSTTDMVRPMKYASRIRSSSWSNLCGEDSQFLPYLACGGTGIISVSAGVAPSGYMKLWNAWTKNDWTKARAQATKLLALNQALGCASNPLPVKYALERMGFGTTRMRYTLGSLDDDGKRMIMSALPKSSL
jgi:4-hydroxy-tetrahydrodipicolinate synthase